VSGGVDVAHPHAVTGLKSRWLLECPPIRSSFGEHWFEVGSEKLRYLVDTATAVHPDGRTASINLDDIYEKAELAFGSDLNITDATYWPAH
jgi:hypothetical protein